MQVDYSLNYRYRPDINTTINVKATTYSHLQRRQVAHLARAAATRWTFCVENPPSRTPSAPPAAAAAPSSVAGTFTHDICNSQTFNLRPSNRLPSAVVAVHEPTDALTPPLRVPSFWLPAVFTHGDHVAQVSDAPASGKIRDGLAFTRNNVGNRDTVHNHLKSMYFLSEWSGGYAGKLRDVYRRFSNIVPISVGMVPQTF